MLVTNEAYWNNKLTVDFVRANILIRFITHLSHMLSKWSAVGRKNASFPMVLVVWATGARHFNRTARFRNLELSKERLSNLLSLGYAIKNILSARNQDFQWEIFLPSFRLHLLGRLQLLSHSHFLAPNVKWQSQECLRIPPRLS